MNLFNQFLRRRRKRTPAKTSVARCFRQVFLETLEERQLMATDIQNLTSPALSHADHILFDTGGQDQRLSTDYPILPGVSHDPLFSIQPPTLINEVVFVDPRVPASASLIDELRALHNQTDTGRAAEVEIVVLDAGSDGVEQIAGWLGQHEGLHAIQIVSHGDVGAIQLGNVQLDAGNLDRRAALLARWGNALAPGGDLLLYGCNVGQGDEGDRFLARLATVTGADVAASTNPTGTAALGGDWTLERARAPSTPSRCSLRSPRGAACWACRRLPTTGARSVDPAATARRSTFRPLRANWSSPSPATVCWFPTRTRADRSADVRRRRTDLLNHRFPGERPVPGPRRRSTDVARRPRRP